MREVAWVIFDEVHYLRDKGKQTISTQLTFANFFSSWSGLGRNNNLAPRQGPICLSLCYDSQRYAICRVDHEDA